MNSIQLFGRLTKEGQRIYVAKVIVDKFHLLDPKSETQNQSQHQSNQNTSQNKYDYPPKVNTAIDDGRPIDISEEVLPF